MPVDDVNRLLINKSTSISECIKTINKGGRGIALIVDNDNKLINTITDGDIRRAVLDGIELKNSVEKILEMKKSKKNKGPIIAHIDDNRQHILDLMKKHVIRNIPILDDKNHVVDLVYIEDFVYHENNDLRAVIMAGGFGTRLRPLTNETPKPMLPIGDRPILELLIEQLRDSGINNVSITTHYLSENIKNYFSDGSDFGVEINYINEDTPLGTAGALGLMDTLEEPFLVVNADVLTKVDFKSMYLFHERFNADMTVGVRQYDFEVPYGVIDNNGPFVIGLREKPNYNFLVNAGIYLLAPSILNLIPENKQYDMTDLIDEVIRNDKIIVSFPIVEYWLDIGEPIDYKKAQRDIKHWEEQN